MSSSYKRIDTTKRSMLLSNEDLFAVMGKELGREEEVQAYRRLFDEAASKAALITDYPIHVDFELNFICNYRCPFCIMALPAKERQAWGDPQKYLSLETFKRIIDEGVEKGLMSVGFNGNNEPLTVKGLMDYIAYARDKGVLDIIFNTNGALLDEKKSHELIAAGVTRLMVSVDAINKETYETYRVGGHYETVKENILRFLSIRKQKGKRLPLVRLSFLAHANNVDELPEFIAFWQDKVDFFALQSLRDVFLYQEDRSAEMRSHFKVDPSKIEDFFICPQPFLRAMVRNDGEVLPCCSAYGMKLSVGNVHETSLYEIWHNAKMEKIRNTVNHEKKQHEACRKCRQGSTQNIDLEAYQEYLNR